MSKKDESTRRPLSLKAKAARRLRRVRHGQRREGFLGAAFLSFLGVLTSIWAEKFDHAAAVTNFVVAPLALLSGTFYSVDRLSPLFQAISHANPFFYAISGFRYGFIGAADSPVIFGAIVLLALNIVLGTICYLLLRSGWKLRS